MKKPAAKYYSPLEEQINIISHKLGILLSAIALLLLVWRGLEHGSAYHIISFSIFGLTLLSLYIASTIYHSSQEPARRAHLRIFDHASIYALIAGTYTPYSLVTLQGRAGWMIFGLSWGIALLGITLKIFFTGRFKIISTLIYVFMGWIIIFALKPLLANLAPAGVFWLFAGGLSYTLGAILYGIRPLPLNHALFHILVLVGSFCHFISIYFYV
ncbi:MAG: hemolysin III family protein [Candidatus Cloacimonadales bacterium]